MAPITAGTKKVVVKQGPEVRYISLLCFNKQSTFYCLMPGMVKHKQRKLVDKKKRFVSGCLLIANYQFHLV